MRHLVKKKVFFYKVGTTTTAARSFDAAATSSAVGDQSGFVDVVEVVISWLLQ
jgi:hypothetical protein